MFFETVVDPKSADIAFYFDTQIDIDSAVPGATVGLAVTNTDITTGRQWFEIFFNGNEILKYSGDLAPYVFNHELLHALGLEHTFDDSDGDFYLSTDPLLGATQRRQLCLIETLQEDFTLKIYPSQIMQHWLIWGPSQVADIDASRTLKTQIYRLYQPSSGNHLFTSNTQEIDILTGLPTDLHFINEGIAYEVGAEANQNLYRFYNHIAGRHFYTASDFERDHLIFNSSEPYIYEGIAYQVYSNDHRAASSTAVFRYFDPTTNYHFYTASFEEQTILETTHPYWINEGIAWYA